MQNRPPSRVLSLRILSPFSYRANVTWFWSGQMRQLVFPTFVTLFYKMLVNYVFSESDPAFCAGLDFQDSLFPLVMYDKRRFHIRVV